MQKEKLGKVGKDPVLSRSTLRLQGCQKKKNFKFGPLGLAEKVKVVAFLCFGEIELVTFVAGLNWQVYCLHFRPHPQCRSACPFSAQAGFSRPGGT